MRDHCLSHPDASPSRLEPLEARTLLTGSPYWVLPIGDSITYGYGSFATAGYRGPLEDRFKASDLLNERFTGTLDRVAESPDYAGVDDRGHFAITSLNATELLAELQTNHGQGVDSAFDVMADAGRSPDAVVLHVGTNQLTHIDNGDELALAELRELLTYLRSEEALGNSVPILLAKVPARLNRFNTNQPAAARKAIENAAQYNQAIDSLLAEYDNLAVFDLFKIQADQLTGLTLEERGLADLDDDPWVDWILDYDEDDPLDAANLASASGYNFTVLGDGIHPSSLGYRIYAEVIHKALLAFVTDSVTVTEVIANRVSPTNPNQSRVTTRAFDAAPTDWWSPAPGQAVLGDEALRHVRDGLWADVTLHNTNDSARDITLKLTVEDPDRTVQKVAGSWDLSLPANAETVYSVPVYRPATLARANGLHRAYFTINNQDLGDTPDLRVFVNDAAIPPPAVAARGEYAYLDFSGQTPPASQAGRIAAFEDATHAFAAALGINVQAYAPDADAADPFAAERFAHTAAAQVSLTQTGLTDLTHTLSLNWRADSLLADPTDAGSTFTPVFERATVVVQLTYNPIYQRPVLEGLPDATTVTHEVVRGRGVTTIAWNVYSLGTGLTPDTDVNTNFTAELLGDMQAHAYVSLELGPFTGVPGSSEDAARIQYDRWRDDPTRGVWLIGAAAMSATVDLDLGRPGVAPVDFNGDGYEDLFWRNRTNGSHVIWLMQGENQVGQYRLRPLGTDWSLAAITDLDLDNQPDIIWHHARSGKTVAWFLRVDTARQKVQLRDSQLLAQRNARWRPVGAGDFNNDGRYDLVWQKDDIGLTQVWHLNETAKLSVANLPSPGASYRFVAAVDADEDGQADVIWRNTEATSSQLWHMNRNVMRSITAIAQPGRRFVPAAAADFNRDGELDILWRRLETGANQLWLSDDDEVDYEVEPITRRPITWLTPLSSRWV